MTQHNVPALPGGPDPDEVNLGDLIRFFWRQRGLIVGIVLIAGLLGAAAVIVMMNRAPQVSTLAVDFRLRFPGAVEGRYPNGTRFNNSDIVAPSVVRPLYEQLDLERLLPFEDFKAALTVVEANEAIDLLRREYQARLSEKMNQAEREALEAEYLAKRQAARRAEYRLQLADPQGRIPQDLAATLLTAILERWAEEAQVVHGAWTYDVAVPGRALIDERAIAEEDYLVVADMLRTGLQRIDQAAARLSEIPGANLVRNSGPDGLSLLEIRARLADALRFKIDPLYARIHSHGIFRDREATTVYLQHRLFRLGLEAKSMESKSQAINEVLTQMGQRQLESVAAGRPAEGGRSTAAIIPQFGEGFFDKLMEIGVHSADVDFRRRLSQETIEFRHAMVDVVQEQELYESLLAMLDADGTDREARVSDEQQQMVVDQIEAKFAEVLAMARELIDQVQGLHQTISQQNLQPHRIYEINGPLQQRTSGGLGLRRMVMVLAGALVVGAFLSLFAVGLRAAVRRPEGGQ